MLRSSQSETRDFWGLYVEHIRKELELYLSLPKWTAQMVTQGHVYVWKTNDLKHKQQHHLSVQINLSYKE